MTKQKYKLSKRAQEYLKAQGGLQVPYEYPYQDNTSPFDLGQIDPSLLQQQVQSPVNPFAPLQQLSHRNPAIQLNQGVPELPQMSQGIQSPQPQSTIGQIGNSLPLIGSALKLGTGIYSLIQGRKEKRRAKRMEANAQRDLERRMKESRESDFYYTGQTSGSYSDYNKLGGKVMQQGGFMDFYQNQEQLNKQTQNIWTDYYDQYVEDQKIKAQQLQQQGLSDTIGGGIGLASSILSGGLMKRGGILSKAIRYQNGGLLQDSLMQRSTTDTNIGNLNPNFTEFFPIDDSDRIENERTKYIWNYKKENPEMYDMIMGLNPDRPHIIKRKRPDRFREKQDGGMIEQEVNEDLYSADFQSPVQQNQDAQSYFTEVMNKYQALDPQGSLENKAMSWIFEEEPEPKRYDVGDVFQNQGTVPPKGDIATSHNNPGNIKYGNFAQKYGATVGRGATDGGKFAYFPSVEAGLQAQKDLLTSGGYANLTVADAMKRWSNSGYGADLYPEVANKKMKDLTPQELNELVLRQTKRESPTIYNKIYGQ